MRLFVAVDLPEALRERLAGMSGGLPGARWVPPDQLHLTLRFVGDVDGAVFADLQETLAEVRQEPFDLALRGAGHFPPRGAPRVVWVGFDASEELRRLHAAVERAAQAAGLEPEGRRFHPHVTLARLKDTPPRRVAEYLAAHAGLRSDPFPVRELVLYSSVLGSTGATHRPEVVYPLGRGVAGGGEAGGGEAGGGEAGGGEPDVSAPDG
jgi:2'-5' RNA ligase